ncbi:MAG TPA: methylated-DNA--[protein]-cysteine S-methyltransferase [Acidimicrobiales bacterium]|nr:methylated-DNA--[protein]-cysteine S-methyltransferase [Acidimicrobiales bacterium]
MTTTLPGAPNRAAVRARWSIGVPSPIGHLAICTDGDRLVHLHLPVEAGPPPCEAAQPGPAPADGAVPAVLVETRRQLGEYFAGSRRAFDLPIDPVGTEFQRRVWWALADIAYGETISYKELARRVGRPTAYRAVGQANGANPLAIVLPCHRVIAHGGGIGGYGGGVDAKRVLLDLERSAPA